MSLGGLWNQSFVDLSKHYQVNPPLFLEDGRINPFEYRQGFRNDWFKDNRK